MAGGARAEKQLNPVPARPGRRTAGAVRHPRLTVVFASPFRLIHDFLDLHLHDATGHGPGDAVADGQAQQRAADWRQHGNAVGLALHILRIHSLFVLTIVTVLALPINIIAGMLGMNVGGIPLAQHPQGFWIIVAIIVTFTVVAGWLVVRVQRNS